MKKLLLILSIITTTIITSLAQPGYDWAHSVGSSNLEVANKTTVDNFGNVYMCGYYYDTVDFNPSPSLTYNLISRGGRDAFVVKYNSGGVFQWARGFGTIDDYEEYRTIKVDGNGNVYVGGNFGWNNDSIWGVFYSNTGAGTNPIMCIAGPDAVLAKYDPQGNLTFGYSIGGTSSQYINGLDLDNHNNIYVTGWFYDVVDFDPDTNAGHYTPINSVGDADIFLAKYNTNGVYKWCKRMGHIDVDYGLDVDVTPNGKINLCGMFSQRVDFDPGPGVDTLATGQLGCFFCSDNDGFVAQYDTAGNHYWARQIGGLNSQFAYAVGTDASGNVFVSGSYRGTVYIGKATATCDTFLNKGIVDIFLAKFNSTGTKQWSKVFGGATSDINEDLDVDATGNVFITGSFSSQTINFDANHPGTSMILHAYTNPNNYDSYLVKLDANGNGLWATKIGSPLQSIATSANEQANGVCVNKQDNSIVMVGYFNGTSVDFDPTPQTALFSATTGGYDAYIIKFPGCFIDRAIGLDTITHTTISVNAGADSYQWINCANNQPMAGATNSSYTPSFNGTYACIINSTLGCSDTSSCVTVTGAVNCSIDLLITRNVNTLTVGESNAFYQWLLCPSYNHITASGTSQSYTVQQNGTYACLVTLQNGCADTSICYTYTFAGFEDYNTISDFSMYPNPAKESFTLNMSSTKSQTIAISIVDVLGQNIMEIENKNINGYYTKTVDISQLNKGIYFVRIKSSEGNAIRKIVKE